MRVVCPGSFDPVTLGHVDIVRRAAELFGEVVVAVGIQSTKDYVFTLDERVAMAREALDGLAVDVAPIDGLLVDFCRQHGASAVVKGLRFSSDFDYELQQAHMNRHVGAIETVLLPGGQQFGTISSTLIRNVARLGGDVAAFLPPAVDEALRARLGGKPWPAAGTRGQPGQ